VSPRRWHRYSIDEAGVRAVWPAADDGLRLVVDGREVTAGDLVAGPVEESGDRLSWRVGGHGVTVDAVAERLGGNVVTQMSISGEGRLQHVDVERWPGSPAAVGLGQPLVGEGWFAALQHPGAEGFGLAVDVDLRRDGGFAVPPFVVGAAEPGCELTAVWDEVDRVRARPPGVIVLANNWYQLGYVGRMSEETVTAEIAGFGACPVALDWYCLDDPWDGQWEEATGLWGRLDPARFPAGLAALQEACASSGVGGAGLWVSPWGGYFDRHDLRVAWGREHGFEVHEGFWPRLCPAGDRYRRHLAESMRRFTAAGVRYWKIDGVQFDCPSTGHGHATGAGGRTDQMDRFAALLDSVRSVDPGAVLTFTSGSNPSPWWLRHADFLWRGGLDDDAPAEYDGGRHERFATYIDSCLDALRGTSVPVSSIVAFSLVENGAVAYRDEGEGQDAWARRCWLMVGRGTHHHDLYVAPDSLSAAEWGVLAGVLTWARAHERVLARSRMVGGRPQANEPYGFLSVSEGGAILCVRNPSARPQPLPPELQAATHMTDLEPVFGRMADSMEPFEVAVVSGRWRPGTRPGPPG
jgi:hypothetical protein